MYWPQNAEYIQTSSMVKAIAEVSGHKILVSKAFDWVVGLSARIPGKMSILTNKAFGNLSYDQALSQYDFNYQIYDLKTSIERTEG